MRKFLQVLFAVIALVILSSMASFLFMLTFDVPDSVLLTKYGQPPSKFMNLSGGARVHYRDQGVADGPKLVLLHGSNSALQVWEPWVKVLGNEFHIITLDLPGHGLTGAVPGDDYSEAAMVEFVAAFLNGLGIERFALGGTSIGGSVAAHFALTYPERVSKLILVGASGFPPKTAPEADYQPQLVHVPVLRNLSLFVTPRSAFEDGIKRSVVDQNLATPEMVDMYWELNRRRGTRSATLTRFTLPEDTTVRDGASKITLPTLLIWGDKDGIVPLEVGEAYRDAIKGSQLIVYRDVGHAPMLEIPERSAEAVRFFLERP